LRKIRTLEGKELASDNDGETVKRRGCAAIRKWIDGQMQACTCTVALVGSCAANRKPADLGFDPAREAVGAVSRGFQQPVILAGNVSGRKSQPSGRRRRFLCQSRPLPCLRREGRFDDVPVSGLFGNPEGSQAAGILQQDMVAVERTLQDGLDPFPVQRKLQPGEPRTEGGDSRCAGKPVGTPDCATVPSDGRQAMIPSIAVQSPVQAVPCRTSSDAHDAGKACLAPGRRLRSQRENRLCPASEVGCAGRMR